MPPLLMTIDSPVSQRGSTMAPSRPSPRKHAAPAPELSRRPRGLSGESAKSLPPFLPHSPPNPREGYPFPLHHYTNVPSSKPLDTIENNDLGRNRRRCVSLNSALDLEKCGATGQRGNFLEIQLLQSIEKYGEYHVATSKLFNKVGNLHFRKGNFVVAASHYEKAALCESEQHVALLNLGTVYWRTNQLDKAIDCLKQAKRVCSEPSPRASVYHQLGLCYALLDEYQLSVKALAKACSIRVRCHGENHLSVAKTLDTMGRIHWMQGDYDASIHCHGRALTIAQQQGATGQSMEALRNLAAVYQASGRPHDTLLEQLRRTEASIPTSDPQMDEKLRTEMEQLQKVMFGAS